MDKKRPKKQCSKAKREREIIRDLDVLSRRIFTLEDMQEVNQEWERAKKIQAEIDRVTAAQLRLKTELQNLWSEMSPQKRRAKQRTDRT